MYSNSPYNYTQTPPGSNVQAQFSQTPEMGTSFGYPMAPPPYPMQQPLQQMGGQAGMGQQLPQRRGVEGVFAEVKRVIAQGVVMGAGGGLPRQHLGG